MVDFKKKAAGKTTKLASKSLESTEIPKEDSFLNNYTEGNLYKIPLSSITPDPDQPRKYFDKAKLQELADSIKSKGVLQPIIIRKNENSSVETEFIIVAGERRFRASALASQEQIPCIFTTGDPEEIALIENLQRDDLKPVEEAEAYRRIMESHDYTQEQLSSVVGKARSTITEILALNKLPDELKEECRMSDISKNALLEIAKRKDPEEMFSLYDKVKNGDFTVAKIRQLTRPRKERKKSLAEERALEKIVELKKLVTKIDRNKISDESKKMIWDEFHELNKTLNTFLND